VLPVLFWATSGQTDSPFRISAVEVKQRSRGLSPRPCGQLFIVNEDRQEPKARPISHQIPRPRAMMLR
jgi:hypothetical protein